MPENTPILAAAPGIVDTAKYDPANGNFVLLLHPDAWMDYHNSFTYYGHLNKLLVKPMDKINRGDIIGLSGNTGTNIGFRGPHLHFFLSLNLQGTKDLTYIDPYRNIKDKKSLNYWTRDDDPIWYK